MKEKESAAFPGRGRLALEQVRIRQLEREIAVAEQERDSLKKEVAISATQADEIQIHSRPPDRIPNKSYVPRAERVDKRAWKKRPCRDRKMANQNLVNQILSSMSRTGNCYDNAASERFF